MKVSGHCTVTSPCRRANGLKQGVSSSWLACNCRSYDRCWPVPLCTEALQLCSCHIVHVASKDTHNGSCIELTSAFISRGELCGVLACLVVPLRVSSEGCSAGHTPCWMVCHVLHVTHAGSVCAAHQGYSSFTCRGMSPDLWHMSPCSVSTVMKLIACPAIC